MAVRLLRLLHTATVGNILHPARPSPQPAKQTGYSNTDGGSVTLKVENAYYTGSAIGATVEGSFTNGATYKVTYNDSETVPSSIGTHTAMLTVYENGTEKQSVTAQYKISYLDAPKPAYTISGAYEDNGTYWFKTGASVTVNAPDGYSGFPRY